MKRQPTIENYKGQVRTVIRSIYPNIDDGRYAIKRIVGDQVRVWADVLADGHDIVCAALQYRHETEKTWAESRALSIGSDRWQAEFTVKNQGTYFYRVIGWVDEALYWHDGIAKKIDAGLDVSVELSEGIVLISNIKSDANIDESVFLEDCITAFEIQQDLPHAIQLAKSERLKAIFEKYPHRPHIAYSELEFKVYVDRKKAEFSTWYEYFPRSSGKREGDHGTFRDCMDLLPRIAEFGFDTLYFPPIHPIGQTNRKGKNNNAVATKDDVGSCWGIGDNDGGHDGIHADLGSLEDFRKLIKAAEELNIEIAMDFALQATPDHPWVKSNANWFRQRPDGSIQYAENPPKKYQDIYPIYFETDDWENMWKAFYDILIFWIDQGVRIFRVDNPHTKPFGFWEWIIDAVKTQHPDVLFLAEAFSRPAVMQELARLGFTQSYTYYTWRNTKHEIVEYMNELTTGPTSETFRPNFWPNTPDILPYPLQNSSESTYLVRYFMAATLSSNCGVYGPVYELMVNQALSGKEEYMDSEKYQVCHWDWSARNRITELYTKVNHARKNCVALQRTNNIEFLHIEHDQLLAYLKRGKDGSIALCIVSLDPVNKVSANMHLHPSQIGRDYNDAINLTDRMSGQDFIWTGETQYIELEPASPYHLFIID